MKLYEAYVERELRGQPYTGDCEAITDIRAFADICLNLLIYARNPEQGWLDNSGVKITLMEFKQVFEKWEQEIQVVDAGDGVQAYQAMWQEAVMMLEYINQRVEKSQEEQRLPRIHQLIVEADLKPLETCCLYLAVVSDFDQKYERLYSYIQDNPSAKLPTVGLGIAIYKKTIVMSNQEEPWFEQRSPLWKYLLKNISSESGESKLSRMMSVREEVIDFLHGETEIEKVFQAVDNFDASASKVRLIYDWEDLIIEDSQKQLLQQICNQVNYYDVVMNQWGFGKKISYGKGISAVFYGSPGTGKTMAAQVLGKVLNREVYKVDISRLSSKYIGETEKNLNQLFNMVQERNGILFFDEADSLFAKRSAVDSSNDRYANQTTGYLLQRFEEFEGISILATNFINNMDEAFKRRIKFFVRFTFPDQGMRKKLWESMIPAEALVEETIRFQVLASRFELSGSDIKEVITSSAYLAAAKGRGIRNEDIQNALQVHYLKMGKKLSEREILI